MDRSPAVITLGSLARERRDGVGRSKQSEAHNSRMTDIETAKCADRDWIIETLRILIF